MGDRSQTTAEKLYYALRYDKMPQDAQTLRDYGFHRCSSAREQSRLLGLFGGLKLLDIHFMTLDLWRRSGTLIEKIEETFEAIPVSQRGGYYPWFQNNKRLLQEETPPYTLADDFPDFIGRVMHLLEPEDRFLPTLSNCSSLEPQAKRSALLFAAFFAKSWTPHPEISQYYDFGFVVCKNTKEEDILYSVYRKMLFGDTEYIDRNKSLVRPDDFHVESNTCPFTKFWQALEAGELFPLLRQYDTNETLLRYNDVFGRISLPSQLESFLSHPYESERESIWRMKMWTEINWADWQAPGYVLAAVRAAVRYYGFADSQSKEVVESLKKLYGDIFKRGNALLLHNARSEGRILEYVQKQIKNIDPEVEAVLKCLR